MKIHFLFFLVLYGTLSCAQKVNTDESLDKYFADVPLREHFENWVHYIVNNKDLVVDSSGERGVYVSFKSGMKSEFPFPNATKVKILFLKTIYYDSVTNISTDSTWEINIEGVFANTKDGRKESVEVFKYLTRCLKPNYMRTGIEYSGKSLFFRKGRKASFPDRFLNQGYSDELGFYYVMLTYIIPRKSISHE